MTKATRHSAAELSADTVSVGGPGDRRLKDFSLTCQPGIMTGLIGPNGAGKTTALKAIAGLIEFAGEVRLNGTVLRDLPAGERARELAYLPQEAQIHWPLSVREIVALGRLPHGAGRIALNDDDHRAVGRALDVTGLGPLADARVDRLSTGERARVLLARLLAVEARVLLADEPVAALDPAFQLQIMEVLAGEARAGRIVVVVLHDLALAAQYCDQLVLLDKGRAAARGKPDVVMSQKRLKSVYGIAPYRPASGTSGVRPLWRLARGRPPKRSK
jgi:iron complex transport system ATP-binding protein